MPKKFQANACKLTKYFWFSILFVNYLIFTYILSFGFKNIVEILPANADACFHSYGLNAILRLYITVSISMNECQNICKMHIILKYKYFHSFILIFSFFFNSHPTVNLVPLGVKIPCEKFYPSYFIYKPLCLHR